MNKGIHILAIDDETPALRLIEHFCKSIKEVRQLKLTSSTTFGLEYIMNHEVDLVLLDIEMPVMNGLDFASKIPEQIKIIFTTAYGEHALKGFELSAVDYLLKPYTQERFNDALKKALRQIELENSIESSKQYLSIKINYKNKQISLDEIHFIESVNNTISIHLISGEKLSFRESLKNLIDRLPKEQFIRIHRSYIVPFRKIDSYNRSCVIIHDAELPVSSKYADLFMQMIQKNEK